jgi:hypothetical protein
MKETCTTCWVSKTIFILPMATDPTLVPRTMCDVFRSFVRLISLFALRRTPSSGNKDSEKRKDDGSEKTSMQRLRRSRFYLITSPARGLSATPASGSWRRRDQSSVSSGGVDVTSRLASICNRGKAPISSSQTKWSSQSRRVDEAYLARGKRINE